VKFQPFRTSARYLEILSVLAKYGFGEILRHVTITTRVRARRKAAASRAEEEQRKQNLVNLPLAKKARAVLEELGPTFVKFGQLLSNRHELLPEDFIVEFRRLREEVPPVPYEKVEGQFRKDFGKSPDELFREFRREAVAAASIAQVHRARLDDGRHVAVKIRRPEAEETVESDILIMRRIAQIIDRHIWDGKVFTACELVDEFERQINRELDFHRERLNIQKFGNYFKENPSIYVPKVYVDYCSENVLTLDYVEGTRMSELLWGEKCNRADREVIVDRITELMLRQIFINGFYHADPHPGNLLVLKGNVVCFLDFGMMGSIPPFQQDYLNTVILGLVWRDPEVVTEAVLDLTNSKSTVDEERLMLRMFSFMEEYVDLPIQDLDITRSLSEMILVLGEFGIKAPLNLSYILKSFVLLEEVASTLSPEYKTIEKLQEFSRQILMHRFSPNQGLRSAVRSAHEYGEIFRKFPKDLEHARRFLRDRKVVIAHAGLEPVRDTLDNVGSRLVFGLVLSALIVSSALIVLSGIEPRWNGIPLIGLAGFILGGLMGFSFLISATVRSIRRHHRR
jgi:ubiquinone biosynthesis protein